jgi:hypothetical protein
MIVSLHSSPISALKDHKSQKIPYKGGSLATLFQNIRHKIPSPDEHESCTPLTLSIFLLHLLLIRHLIRRSRVSLQDALLDQLLGARTMSDLLVKAVLAHVPLELYLVGLDGRGGGRVWEDVAWNGELVNMLRMRGGGGGGGGEERRGEERRGERWPYARRGPRAEGGSRGPSSDCRRLVGARGRVRRIGELWETRSVRMRRA